MANYCSSCFMIFSDNERALLALYTKLAAAKQEGEARPLLELLGCSDEDMKNVDGRTSIEYITLNKNGDKIEGVRIETESAWSPCTDFIDALIKTTVPWDNLQYVYIAEECGCDLYINTDVEGKFFPERLKIEVYSKDDEDTLYFGDDELQEAFNYIEDLTGIEVTDLSELVDSSEVLNKIYTEFEKSNPEDDGYYLVIHVFDLV